MRMQEKEAAMSINLMRLNCDIINLQNSETYLAGKNANYKSGLLPGIKRLWSNRKNFFQYIEKKLKYEHYKSNSQEIYDFVVPFTERKAEDFMVENYEYVGKGAVYTAVYGNYDVLQEPMFVNPNLDYYAFTDQEIPAGSVWQKIDDSKYPQLGGLDDYHRAKYIKMFPYEFFAEYDFSIWVDGNVNLIADIYPVAVSAKGSAMATYANPIHDCIYTETRYMIYEGRVSPESVNKQMSIYKKDGFPEHFGMREFSIIYREGNNIECYNLMKEWWEHVNKYTMRDQLSLPFILWENGKTIDYIKCLGENWRWNPRFRKADHKYLIKAK